MKKLVILIFLLFSVPVISKQVDSTKARQAAVNEAYRWKNQGIVYSWGKTDCSHLVLAGYKAAGVNFRTGSAANGRFSQSMFNGIPNKISPGQENLLKPGDSVFFNRNNRGANGGVGHVGMVVENPSKQCGGGPLILDTYQTGKTPRTKCLKDHKGYVGAVSMDDMIRANGDTPVNENGQIITPVGSSAGGNYNSAGDDTQKIVKSNYLIDLNAVLKLYVSAFDKGAEAVGTDLIIALTFVFALTFLWEVIKNRVTNLEVIIGDFFFELFKFVFFLVVIKNFPAINRTAMNLCFKVAEAFGSTLTSYYVLNEIVGYYAQNVGVLIGEFSRQAFSFAVITSLPVFVIIFCLIIYTTLIFTYIIFQVVRAVMTYIIGTNFSLVLLPFYFSRYSGEYIPNPFSIFFKCVAQLFFTILIISISLGVLSDLSKFLENTIKSSGIQLWVFKIPTGVLTPALDIMALCTYSVAFTIVALIMKKTLKTITTSI